MVAALFDRIDDSEAAIVRKYMINIPVKVGDLAQELGLKVIRGPLEPKISGWIKPSLDAPARFEIKVNKYEVPERQRFTVAHEIAHFLLHRHEIGSGVVDSIMYRSSLTSRKETEANQLAAEIVMPAQAVRQELQRLGGTSAENVVEEMAEVFRVSIPAMKIRLGLS